jgi:hypothetical protein
MLIEENGGKHRVGEITLAIISLNISLHSISTFTFFINVLECLESIKLNIYKDILDTQVEDSYCNKDALLFSYKLFLGLIKHIPHPCSQNGTCILA